MKKLYILTCFFTCYNIAQPLKKINCPLFLTTRKISDVCYLWQKLSLPNITKFAQSSSTNWAGFVSGLTFNNQDRNSVSKVSGTWLVPSLNKNLNILMLQFGLVLMDILMEQSSKLVLSKK
jgi:hypothetical protein